MLTTLKNNRSLTFYQQTQVEQPSQLSVAYTGGIIAGAVSNFSHTTSTITAGYNSQLKQYLDFCIKQEQVLTDKTAEFMDHVRQNIPNPNASQIRDKSSWGAVKKLVTREELMKLQISDKTSLPFGKSELNELKSAIRGKDLSNLSDGELKKIIDGIIKRDPSDYLVALKEFKATGKVSDLLQSSKLDDLRKALEDVDLSKITNDQYKHLVEKYCEKIEYHHRESISSNPQKQSMPDNIEPLKTSAHDAKHFNEETGKIDYKKPLNERPLNRKQDLKSGNRNRIIKNELCGLGLAVAIGAGIGLTIGFITTLAQTGVTPDSLKIAVAEGAKAGVESGSLAAVSYGIGRTLGEVATKAITGAMQNLGMGISENMIKMVNMGVVGTMTTIVFSVYQFIKQKLNGMETREALIQVGKQALFSMSLLAVSIAAQGIWGGSAGIIVSISVGIIMIIYAVCDAIHQRHIAEEIRVYTINECYPAFA